MEEFSYKIDYINTDNNELLLQETLFHNANGYIGVRANFEEGYAEGYQSIRGSYVNGFYDITHMEQAEKLYGFVEDKQTMLNVADTQGIELFVGGERFSMFEGKVLESKRICNMSKGYTKRMIHWRSPKGKEATIIIKRMTSFVILPLFTIEYSVKLHQVGGDVCFSSSHIGEVMNYSNPNDPRVADKSIKHINVDDIVVEDNCSYISAHTTSSGLKVCTGVANLLSKECHNVIEQTQNKVTQRLEATVESDETIILTKYTIFCDSIRYDDCAKACRNELKIAMETGLQNIYKQQFDYLSHYWDNATLRVKGDDELNAAVQYNMYQLIQSAGKDIHCNIAAKGLSGEGYEGHYFWDTEMYIQPFFVITNPLIVKNLIDYRYSILPYAKSHACIMGHTKGALYPWRTIMGKECSGYYVSGSAQYHINGDVAHGVISYYLATKDLTYMAEKGAEILIETARLWLDVGNFVDGTFQIHEVTGPDEYTCMISNNYFTNVSAQYNLYWAAKIYELLKERQIHQCVYSKTGITEEEISQFKHAAKQMLLPYDEKLGINPQDDSFLSKPVWNIAETPKDKFPLLLHYHPLVLYRHQVCKQADTVFAHFLFEDAQDEATIARSFDYYEKITTHDSSLSTCIFSIVASKLGLMDKAYTYFGDSAKLDLYNTHKNTKDGIHVANMGGNYMAIVYGFGGLRLKEKGLFIAPKIPKQWEGYQFKINYEGSQIIVDVSPEKTRITLLKGTPITIFIYGISYELSDKTINILTNTEDMSI